MWTALIFVVPIFFSRKTFNGESAMKHAEMKAVNTATN